MSRQWSQGGVSPHPNPPPQGGGKRPLTLSADKTIEGAARVPSNSPQIGTWVTSAGKRFPALSTCNFVPGS